VRAERQRWFRLVERFRIEHTSGWLRSMLGIKDVESLATDSASLPLTCGEDGMTGVADDFTVKVDADGGDVTLYVVGEVDLATVGGFGAALDRAVVGFGGVVTVNLAGVTFMDSPALCALLRANVALDAVGRTLVVAEPGPAATRLFELAGVRDTLRLVTEPS
jgi:anti-anti-sigma factor